MTRTGKSTNHVPWKWMALGVSLLAVVGAWWLLPVGEWLQSFQQWIKDFGAWGVILFAGVYILATVMLAPGSPFTIAAGLAFGGWGFLLAWISAAIGASLAFLVARYLVRDRVNELIKPRPKFRAVEKAVSEDGWKIVVLLRLSPVVPFNLQNYFFGVTEIRFWHYVVATLVGILPGTALYVYVGAIGQAASGGDSGGTLRWMFFGAGLVATIIVTVMVTKKAKTKLNELGVGDAEMK